MNDPAIVARIDEQEAVVRDLQKDLDSVEANIAEAEDNEQLHLLSTLGHEHRQCLRALEQAREDLDFLLWTLELAIPSTTDESAQDDATKGTK